MGNLKTIIIAFVLLLTLWSCDDFEMRGFVTSHQSANERFVDSQKWNQQQGFREIDLNEDSYTIHAMGDSHIGGTKNFDTFFDETQSKNAAAALLVGDITTGKEEDYNVLKQHLPEQNEFAIFAVAGNHDLYFDGWQSFFTLFGSSSYYFTVNTPSGSDLIIALESGSGTLGSKQLKWLEELLQSQRNNFRHCLVFTHNNFFRLRQTLSTNPMGEELQKLIDLFLRYRVNTVVMAHDHQRNTTTFGNTTYITLDALVDSNPKAGYLSLQISETGIDFSFVEM